MKYETVFTMCGSSTVISTWLSIIIAANSQFFITSNFSNSSINTTIISMLLTFIVIVIASLLDMKYIIDARSCNTAHIVGYITGFFFWFFFIEDDTYIKAESWLSKNNVYKNIQNLVLIPKIDDLFAVIYFVPFLLILLYKTKLYH